MQKNVIICDKIVANLADNSSNQAYVDVKNSISPDCFDQISKTDQETDFSHFKQSDIQVTEQKGNAEVPTFTEDTVLKSAPCPISTPSPSFSPVPSAATAPFPSLPSLASALPSYAALSTLGFSGASIINMPTCLLEHIIHTTTLSPLEKLYYIVADFLCMINLSKKGNRSIAMPSHKWARLISCSRTKVFALQSSLEAKGYFTVMRSSNKKGQSMRNTVITDIPGSVFDQLCLAKNREERGKEYEDREKKQREYGNIEEKGKDYVSREDDISGTTGTSNSVSASASIEPFNAALESKQDYLSRTKLFIKINYHLMKSVFSISSLPSLAKVLWLELYTKSYIKYRSVINRTSVTSNEPCASLSNSFSSQKDYSFQKDIPVTHNDPLILKKTLTVAISYKELEQKHVLSKSTVSRALKELVDHELLLKEQLYIRINNEDTFENNRQDKSLWFCTLLLPFSIKEEIEINTKSLYFKNPQNLTYTKLPSTIALYDPPLAKTKPLYNRNYILKKIDQEKSNFLKKIFKGNRVKTGVFVEPKAKEDFAGIELSQTKQSIELKRNTENGAGLNHITENLKQGNELIQNSQITEQSLRLNHIAQDIELNHIEPKLSLQTKLGSNIDTTTATYLNLKRPHFQNQKHPLSYFYPLLDEDAIYLSKSSSRDFSLNFINKLLLRLSLKYPDHGFYTKQILLSYLIKVLKHELRQAPIVNNESFDFKPIKGSKEYLIKQRHSYLNTIEQSTLTDFRSQIKRRIIGLSSGNDEYAYHILINLRLPYIDSSEVKHLSITDLLQNCEDNITAGEDNDNNRTKNSNQTLKTLEIKISNEINESQKSIISKAVNEVLNYSTNISFKVLETGFFKFEAEATNNIVTNHSDTIKKSLGKLEQPLDKIKSSNQPELLNSLNPSNPSSPLWQKIRHILLKRYGEAIDISWFSKLDIEVKEGGKQINIKAPNAFIQGWIKNNYESSIEDAIEILIEQEPQGIYEQGGGLVESIIIANLHQGLKGGLNIVCFN